MASAEREFPDLDTFYRVHPGLTARLGGAYGEAARVCLARHHVPPVSLLITADGKIAASYRLRWRPPSAMERRAWGNHDDATRDGAYGMALAAVEVHLGLVALARAEGRTGADYYVGPVGSHVNPIDGELDLEAAFRLEISGIDAGDEAQLLYRLRQKVAQARRGHSNLPAMAGVVGFLLLQVLFETVS